jgi:hypothetical protein
VEWWYAQNVIVYADDEGINKSAALAACARCTPSSQLSIVHPTKYLAAVNPPPPSLRRCLSLTVASARYALLKRLKKQQDPGKMAPRSTGQPSQPSVHVLESPADAADLMRRNDIPLPK